MNREWWCGCCGRGLAGTGAGTDLWCADCLSHVSQTAELWSRTYEAQHGTPCPFSSGGVFAYCQPKDGDVVLACEHRNAQTYHWFYKKGDTHCKRSDGAEFEAPWMCICEDCFRLHSDEPEVVLRRDFVWVGSDPVVRRMLQ